MTEPTVTVADTPAAPSTEPVPFVPADARGALDRDVAQIRERLATLTVRIAEDPDADIAEVQTLGADVADQLRDLADQAEQLGTTTNPTEG